MKFRRNQSVGGSGIRSHPEGKQEGGGYAATKTRRWSTVSARWEGADSQGRLDSPFEV